MLRKGNLFSLGMCLFFTFCSSFAAGQNLITLIDNCDHVRGDVALTQDTVTYFSPEGHVVKTFYTQQFDDNNQLVLSRKTDEQDKVLEEITYYYKKQRLLKLAFNNFGKQGFYYFQYYKNKPLKILEVSPKKDLLGTSRVLLDSLSRPVILKNYTLDGTLRFVQYVEYDLDKHRFLTKFEFPRKEKKKRKKQKETPTTIYEYKICPNDIFKDALYPAIFENVDTKVLNLSLENNQATIVKASKDRYDKEEVYIQEITFDQQGNWIKDQLFRLKKRKQKKILIQETARKITYR